MLLQYIIGLANTTEIEAVKNRTKDYDHAC